MQRDGKLAKCSKGNIFIDLINDKRARKTLQHAASMRASYKADKMLHLGQSIG
jgi:hypothetical protein